MRGIIPVEKQGTSLSRQSSRLRIPAHDPEHFDFHSSKLRVSALSVQAMDCAGSVPSAAVFPFTRFRRETTPPQADCQTVGLGGLQPPPVRPPSRCKDKCSKEWDR